MFEDTVLERDQRGHESIEGSASAPASHEPNVTSERSEVTARAPAQEEGRSLRGRPPRTSPTAARARRPVLPVLPVLEASSHLPLTTRPPPKGK